MVNFFCVSQRRCTWSRAPARRPRTQKKLTIPLAVVVNAVEERVDLDRRLGRGRQRALRALALGAETADRALVTSEILTAVLALEVLAAEVDEAVVEVLAAQVRVAGGGLHLEDAVLDRQTDTSKVPPPIS